MTFQAILIRNPFCLVRFTFPYIFSRLSRTEKPLILYAEVQTPRYRHFTLLCAHSSGTMAVATEWIQSPIPLVLPIPSVAMLGAAAREGSRRELWK